MQYSRTICHSLKSISVAVLLVDLKPFSESKQSLVGKWLNIRSDILGTCLANRIKAYLNALSSKICLPFFI